MKKTRSRSKPGATRIRCASGSRIAASSSSSVEDEQPSEPSPAEVVTALGTELVSSCLCDTEEEARITADAIVADCGLGDATTAGTISGVGGGGGGGGDGSPSIERQQRRQQAMTLLLLDYFDELTREQASSMSNVIMGIKQTDSGGSAREDASEGTDDDVSDDVNLEEEDGDGDGEYIGEGECELCERTIKLTRHHLIPKSTWTKMKKRILNAADAIAKGDEGRARVLLGGSADLLSILPDDEINASSVRHFLSRTCSICRPCHSMVHRLHGEMDLAEKYNTVEKLLCDEDVVKFCKWANKQRPGKFAVSFRS